MDRRAKDPARAGLPQRDLDAEPQGVLFRLLSGRSMVEIWGLAIAMIAALGMLDIWTGPNLGLSPFYLLPVIAVSWAQGMGAAWAVSFVCAGMWLAADVIARHQPLRAWLHVWNAGTRLTLFAVTATLVVQLHRAHRQQREAARTDPLTGVANSRRFDELLSVSLAEARERRIPISFAYIDIDRFKEINDALGHSEGDRVLRHVAEILGRSLRSEDILARLGGDEFGVALLGETDQAWRPLERARMTIRELEPIHPTVSIGLATFLQAPVSVDEMIRAADEIMYEVKETGRGRLEQRLISGDRRFLEAVEASK